MTPRPLRSLTRLLLSCLLMGSAGSMTLAASPPPQRPFQTQMPWSLERGRWEFAGGLLRRDGVAPPFFGEDRETYRGEYRLSLVDATLGLGGGGEVQVRFGLQRFHEEGGEVGSGIEDARVAFGYQLPVSRLDAAIRFEVKLPNAPNDRRLGTDETDIFLVGAIGRLRQRWGWAGNAGFGILGDPVEAAVQDDVLLLGAAGWVALDKAGRWTLLGEANGIAASRFGNDFRVARLGLRMGRERAIDVSVRRGLTSESEDWGLEAGMTFPASRSGR